MQYRLTKRGFGSCIGFWALALACCTTAAAKQYVPLVASLAPKDFVTVSDESPQPEAEAQAPDSPWSPAPAPQPTANESIWSSVGPKPNANGNLWSTLDGGYRPPAPMANRWFPGGKGAPGDNSTPGCFSLPRCQPAPFSTWYVRAEYFHTLSRFHSFNYDNEAGPLYTLGYTRTWGDMRVRFEVFGGDVTNHGWAIDNTNKPLFTYTGRTVYYGGRFEYDFFCNLRNHPNVQLVWGLGIRVWDRQIGSSLTNGVLIQGLNETWFTFYPYIGFESRRDLSKAWEFYGRTRIGVLAWNIDDVTTSPSSVLYPRPGVTALLEEGVRVGSWLMTGYVETFGWARSGSHDGFVSPATTQVLAGVKAGFTY
jgi:hypothetical protein